MQQCGRGDRGGPQWLDRQRPAHERPSPGTFRAATLTGRSHRMQARRAQPPPNGEPVSVIGVGVVVVVVPPVPVSPLPESGGVTTTLNAMLLRPASTASRLPAPSIATTSTV